MGTLARFDLTALIKRYGIVHFAETGTGDGQGLFHAAKFSFRTLASCDLEKDMLDRVAEHTRYDSRIKLYNESSVRFLRRLCMTTPVAEPILFWLDAHFPGADYGIRGYAAEPDEEVRLPLRDELRAIADLRPMGEDVILCDDLRIFVDGPFQHRNVPDAVRLACPKERSIDFVREIVSVTHDVNLHYEHEGYIEITPKVLVS